VQQDSSIDADDAGSVEKRMYRYAMTYMDTLREGEIGSLPVIELATACKGILEELLGKASCKGSHQPRFPRSTCML
jgi:hypothetical protein